MRKTIYTLCCLVFVIFLSSCEEAEVSPCVEVRVVENDTCGRGVVLLVKDTPAPNSGGFCGTGMSKYVTVDNVPDNLKEIGTTFTCRLKDRKEEAPPCLAIYKTYPAATITDVCSQPEPAPVVADGN